MAEDCFGDARVVHAAFRCNRAVFVYGRARAFIVLGIAIGAFSSSNEAGAQVATSRPEALVRTHTAAPESHGFQNTINASGSSGSPHAPGSIRAPFHSNGPVDGWSVATCGAKLPETTPFPHRALAQTLTSAKQQAILSFCAAHSVVTCSSLLSPWDLASARPW